MGTRGNGWGTSRDRQGPTGTMRDPATVIEGPNRDIEEPTGTMRDPTGHRGTQQQ